MTLAEIQLERKYRIQERLGILCGAATPTPEQVAIAKSEADAWEKSIPPEQSELMKWLKSQPE